LTCEPRYGLDLGIIAPVAFLGGFWVLRRRTAGSIIAAVLLVLNGFVGPMVVSQSIFQIRAGVALTTAGVVIFGGTFVVTSSIAATPAITLLRSITPLERPGATGPTLRSAGTRRVAVRPESG
jgi:hypothetical protein